MLREGPATPPPKLEAAAQFKPCRKQAVVHFAGLSLYGADIRLPIDDARRQALVRCKISNVAAVIDSRAIVID